MRRRSESYRTVSDGTSLGFWRSATNILRARPGAKKVGGDELRAPVPPPLHDVRVILWSLSQLERLRESAAFN